MNPEAIATEYIFYVIILWIASGILCAYIATENETKTVTSPEQRQSE